MANLFDTVIVEMVEISEITYPSLIMVPLRSPSIIYETDHYFLEKYVVDKSDSELMDAVSNVILYQSVVYYMYADIYMATYFYMGEFDLGISPEFIDITNYFRYANNTIVDTATDINNYVYVYRIVYQHNGIQHASDYILGYVSSFENENVIDPTFLTDDMVVVSNSTGSGSLYRTSRNGTMVMKGHPMVGISPRYKGPIESDKTNCAAFTKVLSIDSIENKVDAVDDYTTSAFVRLQNAESDISTLLRGVIC